jgi:hypothetical protein
LGSSALGSGDTRRQCAGHVSPSLVFLAVQYRAVMCRLCSRDSSPVSRFAIHASEATVIVMMTVMMQTRADTEQTEALLSPEENRNRAVVCDDEVYHREWNVSVVSSGPALDTSTVAYPLVRDDIRLLIISGPVCHKPHKGSRDDFGRQSRSRNRSRRRGKGGRERSDRERERGRTER